MRTQVQAVYTDEELDEDVAKLLLNEYGIRTYFIRSWTLFCRADIPEELRNDVFIEIMEKGREEFEL